MTAIQLNKAALVVIMACLICAQSCKKGCTDPNAINYTPGVMHDNATCLYCDSTLNPGSEISAQIEDINQFSPYVNQIVLFISVIPTQTMYYGNGCQQLGLGNNNSNCTPSMLTAIFTNETNYTMVTSGTVVITATDGSYPYSISSLTIAPQGTDTINIGKTCLTGFFSMNFSGASFQYH